MAKKRQDKKALRVRDIFDNVNTGNRQQWEFINQKGFDFANDNQLSADDKEILEEQGMPTFTINRIIPVVEIDEHKFKIGPLTKKLSAIYKEDIENLL